jgi:hypothetical protein
MNTTKFNLKRPFKYSHEGSSDNRASFVTLFEPDYSNPDYFMDIQDIISTSQVALAAKFKNIIIDSDDETPSGETVEKLHQKDLKDGLEESEKEVGESIKGAGKSKELVRAFRKMVKNSKKAIAMIDDKEKMTASLLNQLWPIDLFNMAVRWASFFVFAPEEPESPSSGMPSDSVEPAKVV